MSEPVSAFQAYKTNGAKYGVAKKKKTAGGKGGKPSPKKNKSKNANSPKTGKKASTRNANNSKPTIKSKETKKAVKNKQSAKPAASSDSSLTSNGFILPGEVDKLVEELYEDSSPSNPRKLSKSQQKKKKHLEEYLVRQLEMEDDEGNDEISYTEEFTLNSHSEDDDDETDMGTFSYTDADSDNEEGEEFDLQALEKAKSGSAQKRKSNEGATEKDTKKSKTRSENGSDAAEIKKTKKSEQTKTADASARKSMSTSKSEKQSKIEKKHRSVGDMSSVPPTSHSTPQSAAASAPVKLEPPSPPSNVTKMNSIEEGLKAFRWLLSPVTVDDFFAKYWEKNACLVQRRQSNFFSNLISFEAIDQMLLKNHVEFTKNIDVTSYKNGVRETLNPEGRAMPPAVWDHYGQGCSIRLLNPQTFLPALFTLSTTLQEYFHCLVGANAYLTPPHSQGFAPHYDDIEAFVLQIEGRKRWKLYKPRSQAEMLPRVSSKNFTQQEIGKPILDEVLQHGDVLYFPRGTIHQACTEPGYHSLHITLSVYQKQSFADLFEKMMPIILQKAIANNLDMRRGLPLHTWHHAGIAFSDNDTKERAELLHKVAQLLGKCLHSNSLAEVMDSAVDQVALKFQHEALPPQILPAERLRTVFGSRSRTNELGECVCDYDIDLRSNVRLLRANIVRLVNEEQSMRVYYYLDNSKEYCQYERNFIEIETEEAGSIEVLIKSYPQYVGVSQLPLADDERKIQVVTALWERGLLMLEKPFK